MARHDPDAADGGSTPPLSTWDRITGSISNFMLKPAPVDQQPGADPDQGAGQDPTTIPEIEAAIKRASDKERAIGLLAAPIAAAIGLLVTASLVAHDPAAHYANGQIDKLHVNPSLYAELCAVTLVLALVMLVAAWFRKRLIVGIAMALYGLSLFNLHYWGFGVPFIMGGVVVPGARLPAVGEAQARQGRGGGRLHRIRRPSRGRNRRSVIRPPRHRSGPRRSPSGARSSKPAELLGGRRAGSFRVLQFMAPSLSGNSGSRA